MHQERACLDALLAADGLDVNRRDDHQRTALHFACENDDCRSIRAIAKVDGVDLNMSCRDGYTPLLTAAKKGNTRAVQTLLKAKGIRVGLKPDLYPMEDALHIAAFFGHTETVRAILLGGGCRFKLNHAYARGTVRACFSLTVDSPAGLAVHSVLRSGVDYWQRRHHAHHSWAMKQVVQAILLAGHRLAVDAEGVDTEAVGPATQHTGTAIRTSLPPPQSPQTQPFTAATSRYHTRSQCRRRHYTVTVAWRWQRLGWRCAASHTCYCRACLKRCCSGCCHSFAAQTLPFETMPCHTMPHLAPGYRCVAIWNAFRSCSQHYTR